MDINEYIINRLSAILAKADQYRKEQMRMKLRLEEEKKIREDIMELYRIGREINHLCHDMRGKLETLYWLLKKGNYTEAEKNLEQIYDELKKYPALPEETGNEGLNAALINYIPKCTAKGIRFSYVILGKPDWMDSVDMGNLVYNLFSNCLDACIKTNAQAFIEIVVRSDCRNIEIRVENSIAESVLKTNPALNSQKEQKHRHGFGMKTIYRITKKYYGIYDCWEENGRFIQEISLWNEKRYKQ